MTNHNLVPNLGIVTAAVLAVLEEHGRRIEETHDDLRAFGAPSECYELAFEGSDEAVMSDVLGVVHSHNVTLQMFLAELEHRVDGAWLYYNIEIHLVN